MLAFIFKQIPYNFSFKRQALVGALLGGIVVFIMIFLQPFGTYSYEGDYKYLIFSGFGVLIFLIYLLCARIENWFYKSKNSTWEIRFEIISFVGFVVISSIPIHFYNQVFLNHFFNHEFVGSTYLKHGVWFFGHSVVPVMLILLPFYLYFRNKLGVLIPTSFLNEIEFIGANKGEKISLQKEAILFIKASENYVEIFHTKKQTVQNETFRNTLIAIKKQAPFLYKSHRSYLVNISSIKSIKGNSQNAKIEFRQAGLSIPLSKSYYKTVKLALGNQPKN